MYPCGKNSGRTIPVFAPAAGWGRTAAVAIGGPSSRCLGFLGITKESPATITTGESKNPVNINLLIPNPTPGHRPGKITPTLSRRLGVAIFASAHAFLWSIT